jgi:hypothetical protein
MHHRAGAPWRGLLDWRQRALGALNGVAKMKKQVLATALYFHHPPAFQFLTQLGRRLWPHGNRVKDAAAEDHFAAH